MQLTGYVRPDGRVGFRNHLIVLPLVGCVSDIARRIADSVGGAMSIVHPHGCEFDDFDSEWLGLQMTRLATHPNVGGVVFLTLGCGATNEYGIAQKAAEAGKLVGTVNFHQMGGTNKSVQAGSDLAGKMMPKLQARKREPVDTSAVIMGTKCGSSDKTSVDVLHHVTAIACDRLVDEGGTVVLAENCELWQDIETLAERAANEQVKSDILKIRDDLQALHKERFGKEWEWSEKGKVTSLKRAAKAGTRAIQRVIPLEGTIEGPGLVIHDGPNTDLVSVTSMAVAGCNLQLFTTGMGTAIGGPCVPTIKVTANRRTQELMSENIDVGVGEVTEGEMTREEGADKIYDAILRTANGEQTKSEKLGHFEMQFHIKGVTW